MSDELFEKRDGEVSLDKEGLPQQEASASVAEGLLQGFEQAEPLPGTQDPAAAPTAGAMLRAAREAAGMHIAALSVVLKVPISKLKALEADRYEALPDMVFTRALASSVCRTLKIDPAPIMTSLPCGSAPAFREMSTAINMPLRDGQQPHFKVAVNEGSRSSSRFIALAVVILLMAALLLFWPQLAKLVDVVWDHSGSQAPTSLTTDTLPPSAPPAASSSLPEADGQARATPEVAPLQGLGATTVHEVVVPIPNERAAAAAAPSREEMGTGAAGRSRETTGSSSARPQVDAPPGARPGPTAPRLP